MAITATPGTGPVAPTSSTLRPLPATAIRLVGGYWGGWQERNATVILQHCEDWLERIGWTKNFDLAASGEPFEHIGIEFVDSEIYKLLEAMAWELGRTGSPQLAARYDHLVRRVAAAQDEDGYLHTDFGRPWQRARWSEFEGGHELYCMGHLIQAAVARIRIADSLGRHELSATSQLVDIATRVADYLVDTFGDGGRVAICGHPEIEPALVEFGRATGDDRYVRLAQLFIDRRGTGLLAQHAFGQEYFQDDTPVRDATTFRGHAVRALYLAAGAVDVAVETNDAELLQAVEMQWANAVAKRTYLTGAMGSHHLDEAFGADWELPPDREYGETCAAIASNMVSWRLLLQTGDPKYADLIERTLHNAMMVAVRQDGGAFFYANTMHQRVAGAVPSEHEFSARALASLRAPWFEVSCCPTNLARTLASVESVFATTTDTGVQLHQYGNYDIDTVLENGARVGLAVRSEWPYAGKVTVRATEPSNEPIVLQFRVPEWAQGATLQTATGQQTLVNAGNATLKQTFAAGDEVILEVPMTARFTTPDPRIDAVRGTVAVERGPLVYAVESTDLGHDVANVAVANVNELRDDGPHEVHLKVVSRTLDSAAALPYGSTRVESEVEQRVRLVPYALWANRGPSTMRVFIPRT